MKLKFYEPVSEQGLDAGDEVETRERILEDDEV